MIVFQPCTNGVLCKSGDEVGTSKSTSRSILHNVEKYDIDFQGKPSTRLPILYILYERT